MTAQTHIIRISDRLYQRLRAFAPQKPIDEVAEQVLEDALPSSSLHTDDFAHLEAMSDAELWKEAQATFSAGREAAYDDLLFLKQHRELTAEEQLQLNNLRTEADQLMLQKSAAYALLHKRGHNTPNPYDPATYG